MNLIVILITVFFSLEANAQLKWEPYQGNVPVNAVVGGQENGKNIVVCRGQYNGNYHPGKLINTHCNIGWGGREIVIRKFEILINEGNVNLKWVRIIKGNLPSNMVEAGKENGQPLYVGRVTRSDGSVHPGKVLKSGSDYICNYGYGGAEITEKNNFEVLTITESAQKVSTPKPISTSAVTALSTSTPSPQDPLLWLEEQCGQFFSAMGDINNEFGGWVDDIFNGEERISPRRGSYRIKYVNGERVAVVPEGIKHFELEFDNIYCTNAYDMLDPFDPRDENGNIDIYGSVGVLPMGKFYTNKGANIYLFNKRPGDNLSINEGYSVNINEVKDLYIQESESGAESILLHSFLMERDDFDNDNLFNQKIIDLKGMKVGKKKYVQLNVCGEEDECAQLNFTITRRK